MTVISCPSINFSLYRAVESVTVGVKATMLLKRLLSGTMLTAQKSSSSVCVCVRWGEAGRQRGGESGTSVEMRRTEGRRERERMKYRVVKSWIRPQTLNRVLTSAFTAHHASAFPLRCPAVHFFLSLTDRNKDVEDEWKVTKEEEEQRVDSFFLLQWREIKIICFFGGA